MSRLEKIQAMEALWDSLNNDDSPPELPEWHGEILDQRRVRVDSGMVKYTRVEDLKARGIR